MCASFTEVSRASRFIVRDFAYSEDLVEKQREELAVADTTEKELWVRCYFSINSSRRTNIVLDGATSAFKNKLLRSVPDIGPLEGPALIC